MARRNLVLYSLLASVWALVVVWQAEEHYRVREAAKTNLSNRSKDIANTVSACLRGMRFRSGAVLQERIVPVLDELVNGRTNELVKSSELLALVLLNASNESVAEAGRPIDLSQQDIAQQGERWGQRTVVFVHPVDLGTMSPEGATNPTVILPPIPRDFHPGPPPSSHPDPAAKTQIETNIASAHPHPPPFRRGEPRRPPWLRNLSDEEYQSLMEKRALHGLAIAMSTESFDAASTRDLYLRSIIVLLATVSALGTGVAWRSLMKSSDLQIRLVRASELNTHLKEMNLAAAGLAHETRNPLNIIRGLAQMISKQPETSPEIAKKSHEIVDEADKVAAQLNEFINYSRPREVRRASLVLNSVVNEVVRTLSYDLEEKKITLQVQGDSLQIEADEQLLRQALFNLLLNAVQAVNGAGNIQIVASRKSAAEAALEVRDNGPGVPPERRAEIFKPYFTTQKTGTGLGLAVVQQIVLAHGWEIECLPNQPQGAIFRITHLKIAQG
ncbi:MAG TPA: ATP-binding protein [Verrucomicrobiae bacterium]|nr:ATP-binding protein [Verrucomicrobiae bacterium]